MPRTRARRSTVTPSPPLTPAKTSPPAAGKAASKKKKKKTSTALIADVLHKKTTKAVVAAAPPKKTAKAVVAAAPKNNNRKSALAVPSAIQRKKRVHIVEPPAPEPPAAPTPPVSSASLAPSHLPSVVRSSSSLSSSVQPSIQGMSIAQIRAVRGEQRRMFEETGYVDLVDEVAPGVLRIEFNNRYAMGILTKRLDKHRRASAKKIVSEEDDGSDALTMV